MKKTLIALILTTSALAQMVIIGGGGTGGAPIYTRSTTGNDTYVGCPTTALTSYTTGLVINLNGDTGNTGPATVNLCSLGAKSILRNDGSALTDGLITANKPILLSYDGTQFVPVGPVGGGGGTASLPFTLARTSATVMSITGCTSTAPCNTRVGDVIVPLTTTPTVTLSGTACTSSLRLFYTNAGALNAALNTGGTCTITGATGITNVAPLAGFPAGSVPLYHLINITTGAYDTLTGAEDARALVGRETTLVAGAGCTIVGSTISCPGSGGGVFNPVAGGWQVWRHMFTDSAYTSNVNAWSYNGVCAGGTTFTGSQANRPGSPTWKNNDCFVYYPSSASDANVKYADFASGATPKPWHTSFTTGRHVTGGDIHLGGICHWVNNNVDCSKSVFARYKHASPGPRYECVIARTLGSDETVTSISTSVDGLPHTFLVSGGTNSASCSMDGAAAVTVTGTIPTFTNGIRFAAGTISATGELVTIQAAVAVGTY